MTSEQDIEAKFWKSLKSDRTVMLGLGEERDAQPMTAQMLDHKGQRGPIWFVTTKDTDLAMRIGASHPAFFHFAGKGHDLFASVEGELFTDNDRETLERLWNPFLAAWFEGGKDDPTIRVLRFEPSRGQVWLNENSLFAGVRILLGRDPKQDYADKVADLDLNRGPRA